MSQQVRSLEQWLGGPLFERGVRQLRLTPRGRQLAEQLRGPFAQIDAALQMAREPEDGRLRVSALPLFTQSWLIPRLGEFERAHPGVVIELDSRNEIADLARGEADVAIRNIRRPTPGLAVHKLMDVRAITLCSPSMAHRLKGPADLRAETLIHITSRRDGWSEWFRQLGYTAPLMGPSRAFDTIPAALDAAVLGHGVVLGLDPFVWDTPQAERLVCPFNTAPISAGAYFVAHRREDGVRPAVRAFVGWLRREVARDARRLSRLAQHRRAGAETSQDA